MVDPVLQPREAAAAKPTAPVRTGAKPAEETDPKATPEGSETLRTLKELKARFDESDKRNRDKDAHIGRLTAELQALKKPAAEQPQHDPVKDRLDKAIENLDGGEIGRVIEAVADRKAAERFAQHAPQMLQRAEEVRKADEGFGRLKSLGVTIDDPKALAAAARGLPPDAAYLGALVAEGRHKEALDLLTKGMGEKDAELARAEALDALSGRNPEGLDKLRARLNSGGGAGPANRGQTGYQEGEGASLMYEMSLAPHARHVKNFDDWVGDEDSPGSPRS